MNRSLDLGMIITTSFQSPLDTALNYQNPLNAIPNRSPQIPILHTNREQLLQGDNRYKDKAQLPKLRPDHAGLSNSTTQK
jgi:hypothetical protein